MPSDGPLSIYDRLDLEAYTRPRERETRIGEDIGVHQNAPGAVIIGIPEDIGVRANFGRPGAAGAWKAFLSSFVNLPVTASYDATTISLLAEVPVADLMAQSATPDVSIATLREMCATIDQRVELALRTALPRSQELVLIGGGHNNAFPLLCAFSETRSTPAHVINFDAHTDCRPLEGRHSGNAFSYAYAQGRIASYTVIGLDEDTFSLENDEATRIGDFSMITLRELAAEGCLESALFSRLRAFAKSNGPIGVEVDLDVIPFMPSSAMSPSGIPLPALLAAVGFLAETLDCAYLHLPEGAPTLGHDGDRTVGKALSALTMTYLRGRGRYRSRKGSDADTA